MKQAPQNLGSLLLSHLCSILFPVCLLAGSASAQATILHLKNGDRISGLIASKNANRVVISNAWVKALSIPLSEIASFQTNKTATAPASAHPATKGRLAARRARVIAALKPSVIVPAKLIGIWHGQINIGTSIILSRVEQRDCSVHAKFVYQRPYQGNPKKFFRNTIRFGGEYQRTDNHDSANHAHFDDKADFDLWNSFYAYGQDGVGYDRIQNIDFQDRVGPGGAPFGSAPKFGLKRRGWRYLSASIQPRRPRLGDSLPQAG